MLFNVQRILLVIAIAVWFSVLIKYESFAFLSRKSESSRSSSSSSSSSSDSHRIRQTIRESYHKVADKISDKIHSSDNSKSEKPSSSSDSHRIRDKINDKIHKIIDKPKDEVKSQEKPKPVNPSDSIGGSSLSDKVEKESDKKKYLKKGFAILGSLAKKIATHKSSKPKHNNPHSGYYDNYNYRPNQYGKVVGAKCSNTMQYDEIVLGEFICPVEGFELDETACCGLPGEQYCCRPTLKYQQKPDPYYQNNNYNTNNKRETMSFAMIWLLIMVPLLFISLILCGVLIFICYKKRIYKEIPQIIEK